MEGHGLVYNPGERVEGYTNFLWTLMIAAGLAAGADPVAVSRGLGMAASLALVALCFAWARGRDRPRGATGGLVATAVVAASPSLATEAVQGLETAWFALVVTAALLTAVGARDRAAHGAPGAERGLWLSAALFAVAALTRPEGAGVFALATGAGWLWRRRHPGGDFARGELGALALFAAVFVGYWGWRFDYYGAFFPNTFTAKTGGGLAHLARGLDYEARFLLVHPVLALLTGWALAAGRAAGRRGPPASASCLLPTALCVVTGYLVYVAVVGGDFKPTFRFVLPVLALWGVALDDAVSRWAPWPSRRGDSARTPGAARAVATAAVAGLLVGAATAAPASLHWAEQRALDLARRTAAGLHLAEHAEPDGLLAIHSAGIIPYYSKLPTVDMWGINDRHIASQPLTDAARGLPAGHEKGDATYVFSRRPRYFVDEVHFMAGPRVEGLRELVSVDLRALGVREDYAERHALLRFRFAGKDRRYWFNYLERR